MSILIGLEAALRKTSALVNAVQKEQHKALAKVGYSIQKATKQNIMTMSAQQRSLASKIDQKIEGQELAVGYMDTDHATFFEFGTGIAGAEGRALDSGFGIPGLTDIPRGHEPSGQRIVPKSAKFLHWKDRETGEDIFARSTRGQAPHPALRKAVAEHIGKVREILQDENVKMIQEAAGR